MDGCDRHADQSSLVTYEFEPADVGQNHKTYLATCLHAFTMCKAGSESLLRTCELRARQQLRCAEGIDHQRSLPARRARREQGTDDSRVLEQDTILGNEQPWTNVGRQ